MHNLRVARLADRDADDLSQQRLGEQARLWMSLDSGGQWTAATNDDASLTALFDGRETAQLSEELDCSINSRA